MSFKNVRLRKTSIIYYNIFLSNNTVGGALTLQVAHPIPYIPFHIVPTLLPRMISECRHRSKLLS